MLRRKRCWKAATSQHAYEGFVNTEGVTKEEIRSDEEDEALSEKPRQQPRYDFGKHFGE